MGWVCTGFYDNVILQLMVIPIKLHVDIFVNIFVNNILIGGNIGLPFLRVVADKIIDFTFL